MCVCVCVCVCVHIFIIHWGTNLALLTQMAKFEDKMNPENILIYRKRDPNVAFQLSTISVSAFSYYCKKITPLCT